MLRIISFLLLLCNAAAAQQFFAVQANPQIGVVVGGSDLPGMFLNWVHNASGLGGVFDPADFDANGYPNISSPATNPDNVILNLPTLTQYSGTWEYGFSGTGARQFQGTAITVVSDPQGCTSATNGKIVGTNCDVTFNFNTSPSNSFNLQFVPNATYTGMNSEYFIRSSDKTAFLAGQILTPEFLAVMQGSQPLFVRTLGLTFPTQQAQICASWAYRTPVTANSWTGGTWFPGAISPSITGTDQYAATAAANTPGTWTDQEILQGTFPNASNPAISISAAASDSGLVQLTVNSTATLTTNQQVLVLNAVSQTTGQTLQKPNVYAVTVIDGIHVDLQGTTYSAEWVGNGGTVITTTINIGSRGPKFMVAPGFAAASISAGGHYTLFYDAPLDLVIANKSPELCGVPFEEQAELANEIGRPLWQNIPPLWRSADVSALVAYDAVHLRNDLRIEAANENWNTLFAPGYQYFFQNGYRIGLPLSNNNALFSYVGLLTRQWYPAAISAWTASRSRSNLHLVSAGQALGVPSIYESFQFSGQSLCGTSCSNPAYQATIGMDYNVSPNRPKDFVDNYSVASYFSGAMQDGNSGTLVQLQPLINAGTEYAASDLTDAFNLIDADNRTPSYCPSCNGAQYTLSNIYTNVFPPWIALAVSDGKKFIAYEGGYSSFGPTVVYLMGLGDTGAPASGAVTVTLASPGVVTWTGSSLTAGTAVAFTTTGALYTGITAGTTYFVANDANLTANTFDVSDTNAHALAGTNQINTSGSQSGTQTATTTCVGCQGASTDATNINNLEIGYRSSQQFYDIYDYQNQQWFGLSSQIIGNSNLQMEGSTIAIGQQAWFLLQGSYVGAVPYQNYNAFKAINLGLLNFLLKRDLNPASNDNTPMYLNEAA